MGDNVADWLLEQLVGESGSEFHRPHVVLPAVAPPGNLPGGFSLFDIACGQGVACCGFSRNAANVTGVDAPSN